MDGVFAVAKPDLVLVHGIHHLIYGGVDAFIT
jgi:hypothetical protein